MRLLLLATAIFVSSNISAAIVQIDDFSIIKNTNVIFQDGFDNGLPPPDNGGNTPLYVVSGGPLGNESGGRLSLDAHAGQAVTRPDAGAMMRQGARVNTSISAEFLNRGLRADDLFSVTGIFDLTGVADVRERYGVRLTDGGLTSVNPNDTLGISVMRTSETQLSVVFNAYDPTAFTFIDLQTIALDLNHDQIALTLSRLNTASSDITASFAYVDGGVFGASTIFTTTDSIFNGEDYTRAGFIHLAPVPVPAAFWLFASGLVGLLGIVRHKSKA